MARGGGKGGGPKQNNWFKSKPRKETAQPSHVEVPQSRPDTSLLRAQLGREEVILKEEEARLKKDISLQLSPEFIQKSEAHVEGLRSRVSELRERIERIENTADQQQPPTADPVIEEGGRPSKSMRLKELNGAPGIVAARGKPRSVPEESSERIDTAVELTNLKSERAMAEQLIDAERKLLEARKRELEELRLANRTGSDQMKELRSLPERLGELGDLKIFMGEQDEIQRSLTPEEQLTFAQRYLSNVEAAFQGTTVKSKREAYALFTTALRTARREAKKETGGAKDIPGPTVPLDVKPAFSVDFALDLTQRALASVSGTGSAVLDAGTTSSLIMFGILAAYGSKAAAVFTFLSPAHIALFSGCFAAVAPTLKKIEKEAWVQPALENDKFLGERQKRDWNRTAEKLKRGAKRTASQAMSLMFTAFQFHSIFWAVASTQQGGDTSERLSAGIDNLRHQTDNLEVRNFDRRTLANFDSIDDLEQSASFQRLTAVEQAIVRLRMKRHLTVQAEASGTQIEGAGAGRGVGYFHRAAAKDTLGAGWTEAAPSGDLSPAAEAGRAEGLAARERIRTAFAERFPDHPGVLIDAEGHPVSIEEQLMIFSQDYHDSVQGEMARLNERYANIEHLGNQIRELAGNEAPVPGETAGQSQFHTLFMRTFASWGTKGRFSAGSKDPSETTLMPDFNALQAPDSPLLGVENIYNQHFLEPSQYFLQLVEQEYNRIDASGSESGGVQIDVPSAHLDPTPLTSTPLHGEPNFFGVDFYKNVFSDPFRSGGAGLLVLIFLFLRHGEPTISYNRFRARREDLLKDFWIRRKNMEGEGDIQEGAEYRYAKHVSSMLNLLLSHDLVKGAFKEITLTPELVLSAMREAAAEQPESVVQGSPTGTHGKSMLAKIAEFGEGYMEALVEIPAGNTPVPPAVDAFNHLVKLYRNPAELSARIAEKLLPGISEVIELSLESKEGKGLAHFPDARKVAPEKAKRYAQVELALNKVKLGHFDFKIRHQTTRIEFMRDEAFNGIYHSLTGTDLKDLTFFDKDVDLRHADFPTLRAQYGESMDTFRHSGLSRLIATSMQEELDAARAEIAKAEQERDAINTRERFIIGEYGQEVAAELQEGIRIREKQKRDLSSFSAPDNPHVAQFSSREAIERQYIEDMVRSVQDKWQGQFTKQTEGVDIVPQLEALQKAAIGTSCFGEFAVPEGYAEPSIHIVPRIRGSKKESTGDTSSLSDSGAEQFTDYHVVTYDFYDPEQKKIFSHTSEIRSLLSENRTPGEIEGMVERYATKLRSYFALRVNLREIDERLKRSQEDTDRHMLAAQSKLRSMGFFDESLAKQGSDFKPIDLFRRGAETGIEILSKELQPYRNRRTRLNELAQGNAEAQRNLKEVLEPAYRKPPPREDPEREAKVLATRESTDRRHKTARERIDKVALEMNPEVIAKRFDTGEFNRARTLTRLVNSPEQRKSIRAAGIKLSYAPRPGGGGTVYISASKFGIPPKQFGVSIATGDLLDRISKPGVNAAQELRRIVFRTDDREIPTAIRTTSRDNRSDKRRAA